MSTPNYYTEDQARKLCLEKGWDSSSLYQIGRQIDPRLPRNPKAYYNLKVAFRAWLGLSPRRKPRKVFRPKIN